MPPATRPSWPKTSAWCPITCQPACKNWAFLDFAFRHSIASTTAVTPTRRKYPRLSLAQPATHDHAPLAAAWDDHWRNIDAGRDVENNLHELRRLMDFAGIDEEERPREFTSRLHEACLRAVLRSNSWLVVVMITDVFGQTLRFNTPGTVSQDNWSVRLPQTVKQLDEDPDLLAKTKTYSRLVHETKRVRPHGL